MRFEDWGCIEYRSSVEQQLAAVQDVAGGAEERIVFCSHPPVVTLGRGASAQDLMGWSGAVEESSRGGRATYHGPSQLVIYPILNLLHRGRDIHAYLRALEGATVASLHAVGLSDAEARTTRDGENSLTGVWCGQHKIASIGIAVRKWVTYHGVAINVAHDPLAFQGIRPCGFGSSVMSSIEAKSGRPVDQEAFRSACKEIFLGQLLISKPVQIQAHHNL